MIKYLPNMLQKKMNVEDAITCLHRINGNVFRVRGFVLRFGNTLDGVNYVEVKVSFNKKITKLKYALNGESKITNQEYENLYEKADYFGDWPFIPNIGVEPVPPPNMIGKIKEKKR
jgi:hypothetical protein